MIIFLMLDVRGWKSGGFIPFGGHSQTGQFQDDHAPASLRNPFARNAHHLRRHSVIPSIRHTCHPPALDCVTSSATRSRHKKTGATFRLLRLPELNAGSVPEAAVFVAAFTVLGEVEPDVFHFLWHAQADGET